MPGLANSRSPSTVSSPARRFSGPHRPLLAASAASPPARRFSEALTICSWLPQHSEVLAGRQPGLLGRTSHGRRCSPQRASAGVTGETPGATRRPPKKRPRCFTNAPAEASAAAKRPGSPEEPTPAPADRPAPELRGGRWAALPVTETRPGSAPRARHDPALAGEGKRGPAGPGGARPPRGAHL